MDLFLHFGRALALFAVGEDGSEEVVGQIADLN
jgi:hypothetical protein